MCEFLISRIFTIQFLYGDALFGHPVYGKSKSFPLDLNYCVYFSVLIRYTVSRGQSACTRVRLLRQKKKEITGNTGNVYACACVHAIMRKLTNYCVLTEKKNGEKGKEKKIVSNAARCSSSQRVHTRTRTLVLLDQPRIH